MPTSEQVEKARKAAPPFWRDTDQCEKYIAKMLTAAAGVKPRIKPLVWEEIDGSMYSSSKDHRVSRVGDLWDFHPEDYPCLHAPRYETKEKAMIAAQADYEARICSALESE